MRKSSIHHALRPDFQLIARSLLQCLVSVRIIPRLHENMLSRCFGFVQLIMPCYCSVSVQLEMDDETELMTFEEQLAQLNATRLKEDKHTVPEVVNGRYVFKMEKPTFLKALNGMETY